MNLNLNEMSNESEVVQGATKSEIQLEGSNAQSQMFVDSQIKLGETSSLSNTPTQLRSLNEIYARSNVNMIEFENYEEATTDNALKKPI